MHKKTVVLIAVILSITLLSGCELAKEKFQERLDYENTDRRIFSNEELENPASYSKSFTIPPTIELKAASSKELTAGYYNLENKEKIIMIGPTSLKGAGGFPEENELTCKGTNGHDYSVLLKTPTATVPVQEAVGMKIELIDEHNLSSVTMKCPIAVVDTQTGWLLAEEEITINIEGQN